jgi:hypothetical protein
MNNGFIAKQSFVCATKWHLSKRMSDPVAHTVSPKTIIIADPPIAGQIYPSWWTTFRGLLHRRLGHQNRSMKQIYGASGDQKIDRELTGIPKAIASVVPGMLR